LYEGGEFIFGTQDLSRKAKNLRRDSQVTVLIDATDPVLQAVMAYENATLDYENVVSKRVKILERYYESQAEAKAFAERLAKAWKTVIIRLKPTKIVSFDYSKPFSID
jgi:nitroimidazol reductase NimA-like FMN-containing flavoprotein (pyridoxamine 5'-phosphate oxidase superfamily)